LRATVDLADEALMDAASAVSGSAPAFVYAFVEALEAAGVEHGLAPADTRTLVRATLHSASALLEQSGEEPAELRRQVTSPGWHDPGRARRAARGQRPQSAVEPGRRRRDRARPGARRLSVRRATSLPPAAARAISRP
jgi:hypothetical protein